MGVGYGAQYLGRLAGARFRAELDLGAYEPFDRLAGAAAAPFVVLLGLWLLVLPALSDVTGAPARLARHSAVARVVDGLLPDPPDASQALRRLAGPAASPQVFGGLLPSLDTGPPPRTTPLTAATVARVTASTVKVEGTACRSERDGSGFSVARDLVMTNAHVVAGQDDTVVVRPDGTRLPGDGRRLRPRPRPGPAVGPRPRPGAADHRHRGGGHHRGRLRPSRGPGRHPGVAGVDPPAGHGRGTGPVRLRPSSAATSTCWPPSWRRGTRARGW